MRVVFVCTANICRSPFLELSARTLAGAGADVEFSSAGTHGWVDERPEHDIADPYRRGAVAADSAAGTISTMLSVIVPRLGGSTA